jgi:hypothetical protein
VTAAHGGWCWASCLPHTQARRLEPPITGVREDTVVSRNHGTPSIFGLQLGRNGPTSDVIYFLHLTVRTSEKCLSPPLT